MANKQLLLLRHAKSDWSSGARTDFERPLSARGRRDAPRMGQWLAEHGYLPDVVVASPSARTTETIELACAAFAPEASDRVVYDQRLYHAAGGEIRAIAEDQLGRFDKVLVVGHNPGMETALLAYCPSAAPFADGKLMPTCALAVIDLAGGGSGGSGDGCTAILRALMRPSLL